MICSCRHLRVSTNLRRFTNQEDLSPNADLQQRQPDWDGGLQPSFNYPPSDARMNDYGFGRDPSYPEALAEPGYAGLQPGYIVEGYPEGVVMRKKPNDRPYRPYEPQYYGPESYPERGNTRPPGEHAARGNSSARVMATSPTSPRIPVSDNLHDLYARVVKPSERDKNVVPKPPRDVDAGRPNFERGPEESFSSSASIAARPDAGYDRWRPTEISQMPQRDTQPSRDHNHNVSKPSVSDILSQASTQPQLHRPGDRHVDGTPMFGDPSKDSFQRPTPSQNTRPSQLPLPSSMRGQYIDELAASKSPHIQRDLMQAKHLSQHGQPSYFQYSERDTTQQVRIGCLKFSFFPIMSVGLVFIYPSS